MPWAQSYIEVEGGGTCVYAHAWSSMASKVVGGPSLSLVKAALLRSYLECAERGLQYSANWLILPTTNSLWRLVCS